MEQRARRLLLKIYRAVFIMNLMLFEVVKFIILFMIFAILLQVLFGNLSIEISGIQFNREIVIPVREPL